MKASLVVALAVSTMILASFSAVADVIELKTGQRVEGAFKQATSSGVLIEVGGQTITFVHDKVRAIYFGSAPNVANQPSLRGEALRALKGLQSAVEGGVSYRDYAPRVTDARIVVDRYLGEEKSDSDATKTAITAAMGYFTLASNAWSGKISPNPNNAAKLALDPLTKDCPSAQAWIEIGRKNGGPSLSFDQATQDGIVLTVGFSSFWSCASNKIAEAEKVLDGK